MVKKADIGVGLYLLCAVIFFIIPIPSFTFGRYACNKYWYSTDNPV